MTKKKPAKTKTLKPTKKGQKKITFRPGGLHQSLGVPAGKPIPRSAFQSALSGNQGALAKRQAIFKQNVLTGPKKKSKRRSGK
jgi:hypothetical protein